MKYSMNINDKVSVRLTKYGKYMLYTSKSYSFEYLRISLFFKSEMEIETQFWILMKAFGSTFRNGSKQIFENNEIKIEASE